MEAHQGIGTYTVCVIGAWGVGRKTLCNKFGDPIDDDDFCRSIMYRKKIMVDNREYFIDVLETEGDEKFPDTTITRADYFIQELLCFALVYSKTDRSSFEKIPAFYSKILRGKKVEKWPFLVLIANKADLENNCQVSTAEGRQLASQYGIPHIEISALNDVRVDHCFVALIRSSSLFSRTTAVYEQKG